MEAKTLNEIHKQGIDALVKVLGPNRLRYGSSRYMIREAAITPKIRKQWLENDPEISCRCYRSREEKIPCIIFFTNIPVGEAHAARGLAPLSVRSHPVRLKYWVKSL